MRSFHRIFIALSLASYSFYSVHAEPLVFKGGVFDGMRVVSLKDGAGNLVNAFLPTEAKSPVPADAAFIVSGLVKAYQEKKKDQYGQYFDPELWSSISTIQEYYCFGQLEGETLSPSVPYYLGKSGDAEQVRIEWISHGHVAYISYFHVVGGRIKVLGTEKATVPPVYIPPSP